MGFFNGLGRVLAGKPVYEPEDVKPAEQQAAAQLGGKVVPTVRLTRVECPLHQGQMNVYVDIHNESNVNVYLDKILLLGTKRELDSELRPGQTRQFPVYSGPAPQHSKQNDAEVQYRTDSDDYFAAQHEVRFAQQDGGYRVSEFRLITPIKDLR